MPQQHVVARLMVPPMPQQRVVARLMVPLVPPTPQQRAVARPTVAVADRMVVADMAAGSC
jgi:hypothetical protein